MVDHCSILLGYLGIHRVSGADLAFYILGLAIFLVFCAAVRSLLRMAFSTCFTGR
jgi:hypothetical protein